MADAAVIEQTNLEEELSCLTLLLEKSDVEGARRLIKQIEAQWPDSPRVQHWARVLAPPVVRALGTRTGRSLKPEHEWLKAHAHEYPGCWIAIKGSHLVAADPKLTAVREAIEENPEAKDALLHFQYPPAEQQ